MTAEKSWSATLRDLQAWTYYNLYTRPPAGGTYYPSACSKWALSVSSAFLMPFLPFVCGYPSSSPCAHCTPNKSLPTLRYIRRHGHVYTGPCPKALTECSPLAFWRSSIVSPICNSLVLKKMALSCVPHLQLSCAKKKKTLNCVPHLQLSCSRKWH